MKPSRRIVCPDCGKQKMLFETERKANDFIKWNADEIEHGESLRAYYCPSCCGWHISHQRYKRIYETNTDRLINAFNNSTGHKHRSKIDRLIHFEDYSKQAKEIFDALPEKIQTIGYKSDLRRYLTEYFQEHSIEDSGGGLRTVIYQIWEKFNKDKV